LKQSAEGKYLLKQSALMNNTSSLAKIIIDHLLSKERKLKYFLIFYFAIYSDIFILYE